MAEEKKKSFPKIPRANWFALREKFKQKPPSEVTISYLSSVLGITEPSAANLIPPLKALGLIGQDNKPTDLAFEWRDDATYPAACEKMFTETYPAEVREIYHEPSTSVRDVATWFSKYLRIGESAASNIASMYLLLLEKDPAKKEAAAKPKSPSALKASTRIKTPVSVPTKKTDKRLDQAENLAAHSGVGAVAEKEHERGHGFTPKLHVDIQIHISPDSTAEQIDKIFESMAKHLPLKG